MSQRCRTGRRAALAAAMVGLLALPGCRSERAPRLVSAELLDERYPDGEAQADETVRLTFDRPLPDGFRPEGLRVFSGPPREELLVQLLPRPPLSPFLDVRLTSLPRALKTSGQFSGHLRSGESPTGLGVDLGSVGPGEEWVDLQVRGGSPVLEEAVWEDSAPPGAPGGNLAVDQGDRVRLVFDREVSVLAGGEPEAARARALVPADLLLSNPEDRLDDGSVPSVLVEGDDPREVVVVLGSSPRLTIAGVHRAVERSEERERPLPFKPSGIAVNGTPVQPLRTIVGRISRRGAISRAAVDIEYPEKYFFFEKGAEEAFPAPGRRTHHTVTPVAGGLAVIAGGLTPEGAASAQVLLHSPDAPRPVSALSPMPQPRYLHTATAFPGEDGAAGTFDDFILIAGGTDGRGSLDTLVAVRLDPLSPGAAAVEALPAALRISRLNHTATLIPPDRVLIEGGRYEPPQGGGGIISTAELLTLEVRGGKVAVREREEIPLTPRMRHSSTYLGAGTDGAHYVYTHGGIGIPRGWDLSRTFFNPDEGVVLAAPTLIRIEPRGGGPARAAALSAIALEFEYRFEMMRYDHRAVAVDLASAGARPGAPREVLIAGGTLLSPHFDPYLPARSLIEQPTRPEDVVEWHLRKPVYNECAAALVLEFRPDEPARSLLRVVESPTGDRRAHPALVPLAHPGVLILGGDAGGANPGKEPEIHLTAEVYLPRERKLLPLAVPLAAPRTGFGAYASEWPGGATVYVLGGSTFREAAAGFADLERLRLEWAR